LNKALEVALSENPTIKIADKEIERVDYSQSAAWYGLIPTLSASGQAMKYVMPAKMAFAGGVMDLPTSYTLSASLDLALPIVVPALWRSIQLTELDMQLALESARASKITLRNDVRKAFYSALLAQDSYATLKEGYDVAKQNYDNAKRLYEVGAAAEYDLVSSEVQMRNLMPNLLQVENGVKQSKLFLKVLMGVGAEVELVVDGNLVNFEQELKEFTENQTITLTNNTDLIQLDIQQKKLTKALQIQRTQRMPTLVGFGKYGYSGTGNKAMTMDFMGQLMPVDKSSEFYSDGLIVGLQLNVPILNGWTNITKEKQLKIQSLQLDMQRDYLESSLNVQAVAALDNMKKAVEQVESNKDNVRLAQKGYDISQKRYDTGMGTMLELQGAALALTQSKLSYSQSISDYLSAKSEFEKIVGM
jgi:outer membrane protein TolC